MTIYLDIDPPRATAQQKGEMIGADGRIHHYTKSRVRAAGNLMGIYLMHYAPEQPLTGAVYLHVTYVFGSKSGRKHHGEWKTTRPDTDNLLKLLKDVMTQCGFWEDDAQIAHECTSKMWDGGTGSYAKRGIYIEYGRLEENENSILCGES